MELPRGPQTALRRVTGALWFGAAPAHAVAVNTGSDITVTFSGTNGAVPGSATAELSNFMFSGNTVTFTMDVTNTIVGAFDARLTSMGFDTNPATTSSSDNSNVYTSLTNVKLESTTLNVCFFSGANCDGGGNGGLEDSGDIGNHGDPGTTGNFTVTLTFASAVPPLDFSNFIAKVQPGVGSSFTMDGTVNPQSVPEPASLALLGSGLLGLGYIVRRRRLS